MNMAPHSPCFEIHDSVPWAAVRDSPPDFLLPRLAVPLPSSWASLLQSSWALHHFQDSSPYLVLQALYGITQLFPLLSFLHCNSIQLLVASSRDSALACVILCCRPFSGIFSLKC